MLFASIVLSVVAALPAPLPATSEPPRLLPLAEGNRWVLRDPDLGGTRTISVSGRPAALVLRGLPGASDLRVRAAGAAVQAWDPADRRWEPFLRLGAAAGTTYKVDLSGTAFWRGLSVTVASRRGVIPDGRGKTLRNCVRLTFGTIKPIADAGLEELVFAPGVGFALTLEQTIAGPRVHILSGLRLNP